MTHPTPDKVTIEKRTEGDTRLVDVTFYAPTYPQGAKSTLPREEVKAWIDNWLYNDSL